jgi:hypothetical protein
MKLYYLWNISLKLATCFHDINSLHPLFLFDIWQRSTRYPLSGCSPGYWRIQPELVEWVLYLQHYSKGSCCVYESCCNFRFSHKAINYQASILRQSSSMFMAYWRKSPVNKVVLLDWNHSNLFICSAIFSVGIFLGGNLGGNFSWWLITHNIKT